MSYEPKPIGTSRVRLPDDLVELVELLARNNHDIWARERMADGWTFGLKRNDDAKEHPDLVPYEDLSDEEKKYDRETVLGTLRAILALGYRIERAAPRGAPGSRGEGS
ncbi:MAG: RyR domain-containing protein [Candidatus Eisenbacteria bacterium]